MPSPELNTYAVFCVAGLICSTAILVKHYSRPNTSVFAQVCTFLAWLVSYSICFVLPLDLLPEAIADDHNTLLGYWNANYWMTFVCMWLFLPILQGYYEDGGFTVKQRICGSLRANLIFYAIAGVFLVLFLITVAVQASLSWDALLGFAVCLANTWGMFLLVLMLGYGLVEVPRSLWYKGNLLLRLKYAHYRTAQVYHQSEAAKDELFQTLKLLDHLNVKVDVRDPIRPQLDEVISACPRMDRYNFSGVEQHSAVEEIATLTKLKEVEVYTIDDMIMLNGFIKALDKTLWLCEALWRDQVAYAIHVEEMIGHANDTAPPAISGANWQLALSWRWEVQIKPVLVRILSFLCASLSIMIVWSELTMLSPTDIAPLGYIVRAAGVKHPAFQQLMAIFPLTYMCSCSFYTLFSIRIGNFYNMYENKSDESSLLFNASLLLRVIAPMGNNFFKILRVQNTSFQAVVGKMEVIPFFGSDFNTYFPVLIAIFCFLFLCNVMKRVMRCFNVDQFEYSVTGEDEHVAEGKLLVRKEKRRRGLVENHNVQQINNLL